MSGQYPWNQSHALIRKDNGAPRPTPSPYVVSRIDRQRERAKKDKARAQEPTHNDTAHNVVACV
jgi:hypothetical protein